VHLAGIAHADRPISEEAYMQINAHSVRSLAEAARAAGVKRVVLMSSVRAQAGPVARGMVRETDEPLPVDAYGRSKLAAERALDEVLKGAATDWVSLRPVLVYGAGVKGNMRSLVRLADSQYPLPFGDFHNLRSLLSLANLASAVEHVLVTPQCARNAFLVADPQPVSVAEMVAAIRQGLGRPARLIPVPMRPIGWLASLAGRRDAWERLAGELIVDTERLRETGWRPVEQTKEALAETARALRA
jgi:UDP-glucose 4-epimerase